MNTINLKHEASLLTELWTPRVVGEMNDQFVKVAKLHGEFTWHKHEAEDELFLVLEGNPIIEYRESRVVLGVGDMHVVPRGTMHNPHCDEVCLVALLEPKTTQHTGDTVSDLTVSVADQLHPSKA